ncbi:cell division protein FtsB [Candidatus Hoaglandella endobia]|uniref:Cell division protein FtsB n=1 Tax=Candidatus Hoaglandella endobia TaxID=1778263 RepID=A0A143WTH2_9ENTR|nr:cell division protein FtsB [Candidatus Hoaglandella endobia]CUX97060.1 Cell division protein FtsB [Candidatus Hoaglandella endobia]
MKKLTLLLLVFLGWLQYSLLIGKNGLHDFIKVKNDIKIQQSNNAKIKARNNQLLAEIDDLNSGQESIEERSRNDLSLIKPGEVFYRLVQEQAK